MCYGDPGFPFEMMQTVISRLPTQKRGCRAETELCIEKRWRKELSVSIWQLEQFVLRTAWLDGSCPCWLRVPWMASSMNLQHVNCVLTPESGAPNSTASKMRFL